MLKYDALWQKLDEIHPQSPDLPPSEFLDKDEFTADFRGKVKVLSLNNSQIDFEKLSDLGISPEVCFRLSNCSNENNWAVPQDKNFKESEIFRLFHVRRPEYISNFLVSSRFSISDIFTAAKIDAACSFAFESYHMVYRFESKEVYYVFVRYWRGIIPFIFIPRLRIIVEWPNRGEPPASEWNILAAASFYHRILRNFRKVQDKFKFSAPTNDSAILIGHNNNLGHHVWTELAGLHDIIDNVPVSNIRYIVVGRHMILPIKEIFPELAHARIVECEDNDLFDMSLDFNLQLIRPVGTRIRGGLRSRISNACASSLSPEIKRSIDHICEGNFVLWINLRQHNKAWVRQEIGLTFIINHLSRILRSNLLVLLDGFNDAAETADRLLAVLEKTCSIKSIVGKSLPESLYWAEKAHVFCSVIGSGLVINTWLAGRPGVAHANTGHMHQAEPWPYVAEGINEVKFVGPTSNEDMTLYSNYDVDEKEILQALIDIVSKFYPEELPI